MLSKGLLARDGAERTGSSGCSGCSGYWIGQLAKRYSAAGPAGMVNRRHTPTARRTATRLASAHLEELRQALSGPAPQGERGTSRTVAEWMGARLGRPVAKQRGWDYRQRLGARLLQPRPRHVAASVEEQAALKTGAADSAAR